MTKYLDLDAPRHKKRGRKLKRWLILLAILLALGGGLLAFSRTPFVQGLLAPVSFFARLLEPTKLTEVDGRVNVLVLGVDTRSSGWSGLTDTILVGSVSPLEGEPALISIPRDLWVTLPCGNGRINAAYNCGGGVYQTAVEFDQEKAANFAKTKIEEIIGIKIPYWVVVNFEGFKEIIDTLGGITVTVETAFDDYYYPTSDYKTKHISFKAGKQVMNGEKALEFARSRKGTAGGDFDRARRQQKVIMAVKDKIMSLNLLLDLGKLSQLYQQINAAVKTNASFGEIKRSLEIAAKLGDLSQVKSLVLDHDSGLIYAPSAQDKKRFYGGADVLLPKGGNIYYTKIQAAVRTLLFDSESGANSEGKP
jgi:LCP family protein required for cell wall assembly